MKVHCELHCLSTALHVSAHISRVASKLELVNMYIHCEIGATNDRMRFT